MPASRPHLWSTSVSGWIGRWLLVLMAAAAAQDVSNGKQGGPISVKLSPPNVLPPELAGRPVIKVDVVTAGGRWQVRERLRTQLGQPLSTAYARAITRELLSTGRYA